MKAGNRWVARSGRWVAVVMALALTGCAGFFPDPNTTGTGTSPGTGNYVFALDPGLSTLTAYTIGTSKLTIGTGSPVNLTSGLVSSTAGALAVSRNNAFLYVGGFDAVYCYSIGTGGALTFVSAGSVTTASNFISMDTSPDGQWMFGLDTLSQTVSEFSMNATTGAIALTAQVAYVTGNSATNAPKSIRATATLVTAALGTGGDTLFTLDTTTGALVNTGTIGVGALQSDNDIGMNAAGTFLYVSRSGYVGSTATNGVAAYTVANGVPANIGTGAFTAAGTTAYSMQLNNAGTYLYVSNRGDSTISQFSVASGVVTALSKATVSPGIVVTSMAADSSGTYLLTGGISSSADLGMYTFDTTTPGTLDAATTVSTGADTIGLLIATTH